MSARLFRSSLPISVFIHLAFALLLLFVSQRSSEITSPQQPMWIEVDRIDRKNDEEKKQIVQSTAGEKVDKARPDAFLGEANRVVDRETVSKSESQTQPKPKAQPQVAQVPETKSSEQAGKLAKFGVPLKLEESTQKPTPKPRWADFSQDFGEVFPEYVKGLKEGETTALNTKEFVYFTYYRRIRQQLDQAWRPILKENIYKIFRAGRHLASDVDHVTKTAVTLNSAGEVIRVQVLEESGVMDLDRAAVDAFNKAGPFPNPPRGLIDHLGRITIRWDFILKS